MGNLTDRMPGAEGLTSQVRGSGRPPGCRAFNDGRKMGEEWDLIMREGDSPCRTLTSLSHFFGDLILVHLRRQVRPRAPHPLPLSRTSVADLSLELG